MSVSRERTQSLWMNIDVAPQTRRLDGPDNADTVVVGSGIAGLSVAYELARRGREVVVLDRGPIGQGMTSRTTAHLSSICDDSFDTLLNRRGLATAKLFYESHSAAIDRIEAVQREEAISCDFRRVDGILFPALGQDPSELDPELDAGRRLGLAMEEGTGLPFMGHEDIRCLRYRNQATFHPLRYLRGLVAAIVARGGRLYRDTVVEAVEEDQEGVAVRTFSGATVRAASAVVATNSPINDRVAIHTKQAPYRTYVMALELPRRALPDALYWDTEDPYHYVRLQPGESDKDYLIVGGADHKTGEADDGEARLAQLESWIRRLVPVLGKATHRWSGQVMETIDYSGFIGRNPGNRRVFVATGDSGQGMTHGALAGLLIADLITEGRSVWEELYDPSRKPVSSLGEFVSENVTAVKNFAEYLAPGELDTLEALMPGHGAIVRQGLSKIAAYRDEEDVLHQCSARCTHVGCHVHWNSLERCWDCPCHGSHFAIDGTALNGPAVSPLAPAGSESASPPQVHVATEG
jgi:glycine/D-amino acid oxidase-like deaminating enzyme/nitrite reductase/ring-hydroxylating ferredoxin subunit